MAHGQASERLRELQELMDADNQALARDLDAGPSDTSPEPHSSPFRVSQSGGPPSWKERLQALKVRPARVIQASELAPAVVPAAYWCSTVACSAAAHIPLPRVSSAISVGIPANRAAKLGYHSRCHSGKHRAAVATVRCRHWPEGMICSWSRCRWRPSGRVLHPMPNLPGPDIF